MGRDEVELAAHAGTSITNSRNLTAATVLVVAQGSYLDCFATATKSLSVQLRAARKRRVAAHTISVCSACLSGRAIIEGGAGEKSVRGLAPLSGVGSTRREQFQSLRGEAVRQVLTARRTVLS